MSIRATMTDLITATRSLVDDPNNDDASLEVFDQQKYQDALDHTRQTVNYLELAPKQTIQAGGAVLWLDYYAMNGTAAIPDWEADAVLQGYPSFATLAPITSDFLVGHWTFDTSVYSTGQRPPVYLLGKTYDRYAAAVEILESWAARMSRNYDFTAAGSRFLYSQQRAGLLALACEYKKRCRPKMLQMVRSDVPHTVLQRGRFDMSRTTF